MHWTQIIYLALLLIGSGAALYKDRWLIVIIMWLNFSGTLALSEAPFAIGVLDMACATLLLALGSRREYIVSGLFVVMTVLYRFEADLGRSALYAIVDVLAYTQVFIMGSGGLGGFIRSAKLLLFSLRHPSSGVSKHGGDYPKSDLGRDMAGHKKRGASK